MKNRKSVYKTLSLISQLGVSMIAPIFLCTFAGVFLERRFSISITIPLIILGILAGGRNAYVLATQMAKEIAQEKDED